nr:retrovirus-related Pol polyprotein from transposon TNT 1-94 [Tanacetum cinerariifolium]
MQTQTSNTLYNAIMEAGSKDRPPMLAPGNYIQWKSRIKRYIDTKPNHELIHFCITNPPYELGWKTKPILDSDGNPTTSTERVCETYKSVTQEIRDQLNAEAEAVQIILTVIDNDIYSTVDACPNACEMWKAIERLKQGVPLCQILHCLLVLLQLVEIVLFIVDSRCSKHMTGNLKLLINFVEKFLGTVKFKNDQIAPILSYGDLVQGAVMIKRVYYVEGLNYNLFSVSQFCDADLEFAFRKSTCYISDLKGNNLLTGSRGTDLYSITLQSTSSPNPICLMAKATSSQAWLWHRRRSYLNFDTINFLSKNDIVVGLPKLKFIKDHLCSSCELGKAKRKSFHTKLTPSSKRQLHFLHMDLCWPMRVASINGKIYVLVIVDDYYRYTWTHFLRSKDETPEVLIDFLRLVQKGLQAQVRVNGVVERRNRTFVEVARTMLSIAKVPLSLWGEAIATACFTQNRSLVIPRHEKTPYHIINDRKPSVKFFYIFGSVCYIVRDGENLDKMKEKVMSKSSAVSTADAPHQGQQPTTPLNNHTTPTPTCQNLSNTSSITFNENINQAEPHAQNDEVADDEFINIFSTPVYQRYPSEHRWTKDHPLEQVIGNPSQSVRTKRQLELDAKMCMFVLTVSRTEPKNIKEAMADST